MKHQGLCLVTGGCGFIGTNLVEKLINEGYRVRVFDMPSANRANLTTIGSEVDFIAGNFLDGAEVDRALEDAEFVFHLVGTTLPSSSNKNPVFDVQSNVVATIRLLEASVRHNVKRVLFASSGGTVYGEPEKIPITEDHPTNPLCSYGITKLTIEKYLKLFHQLHGLDYTILRIANPYGRYQKAISGQGLIGVLLERVREGQAITIWGDGSVKRDYIYVGDVVDAFLAALKQTSPYRIFNIGTGVGTSIMDLLRMLTQVTGIKPRVEYSAGRPVDVSINVLDSMRANRYLDWRAQTDCETGLQRTWDWISNNRTLNAAVASE
jgi:UDP-glucose 4-epimerase